MVVADEEIIAPGRQRGELVRKLPALAHMHIPSSIGIHLKQLPGLLGPLQSAPAPCRAS